MSQTTPISVQLKQQGQEAFKQAYQKAKKAGLLKPIK